METNFAASTSSHILLSHSLAFDLKQVWKFQKKFFFSLLLGAHQYHIKSSYTLNIWYITFWDLDVKYYDS